MKKLLVLVFLLSSFGTGCDEGDAASWAEDDSDESFVEEEQHQLEEGEPFIRAGASMSVAEEEKMLLEEDEQSLQNGEIQTLQENEDAESFVDTYASDIGVPAPTKLVSAYTGDKLNGKLTVKVTGKYLDGVSSRIPSYIHVYFPRITRWSQTYSARDWGLYRSSASVTCAANSMCTATYEKVLNYVNPPNDHPFVNHPDQWDFTRVWLASGAGSFKITDLTVTYQPFTGRLSASAPVGSGAHHFVRHVSLPTALNPRTGNKVSLYSYILARRKQIAEFVTGRSFYNIPATVRYAAYDIGKSGDLEHSMDRGGGCSATMCYYQYLYGNSSRFESDFNPLWAQKTSAGQKYCTKYGSASPGGGPFPNPDGELYSSAWTNTRDLAMVYFHLDRTKKKRTSIDPTRPFLIPHRQCYGGSGACYWQIGGQSKKYVPKIGDMFFRMDRCWHGNSVRHAMTLTRPSTQGIRMSGGDLKVSVMEGSQMTVLGNTMMSVDNDGDGLWDPMAFPQYSRSEGIYLNAQLPNCSDGAACDKGDWYDGESGTTYMKIDIDGDGDEDLRCPKNETGFRYYYLVGQSI